MPNLVLGFASNYHPFTYERFLCSLRRCGSQAEVVLFVGEKDKNEVNQSIFDKYSAKLIAVPILYNLLIYRFVLYQQLLQQNQARFSNSMILLTDVRDVLFQKDPFSFPFKESFDLCFFEEQQTIGGCTSNSLWLSRIVDKTTYDRLSEKPIVCCGTTLGSFAGISRYLELMNQECSKEVAKGNAADGLDQAFHNLFFYTQVFSPLKVISLGNQNGPVNTLHYAAKNLSADGRVVNLNGEASYLVHQIDRMKPAQIEELGVKQDLPVFDLLVQSRYLHGEEAK